MTLATATRFFVLEPSDGCNSGDRVGVLARDGALEFDKE
jgi:hypothetical protein